MRKKNLWKKLASVLMAAAMIMTSVPVYAAGPDEPVEEIVVQETTEEAEDEAVGALLDKEESTEVTEIEERTSESATVAPDYSWYTKDTTAESYSISTAAQLLGLANIVNDTTDGANITKSTFAGKTINLTKNVSLEGIDWKPIGTVVSYPSKSFYGTFDGNGKTISYLNTSDDTPGYATAGLFGSITGTATVKNLTLKNVNVASTHYAGALVGYISEPDAKIENCHVSEGTITSTPEKLGNSYDNGDKVGGIIGYCIQGDKITGCSVENLTIKGYRDIGGIAGYAAGTFEGNTVKDNVKLIVDTENGYKDSVQTTVGLIVGKDAGATFGKNDGQLESVTYKINGQVPLNLVDNNKPTVIADGAATVKIEGVDGSNPTLIMQGSYCGWLEFGEAVLNVSNLTLQDDRVETNGEPSSWSYIPIVVKGKTFNASNCTFNESISVSGVEEASLNECNFNDKTANHYSIWAGTSGLKNPENYKDALKKLTVKNCRFNQTARGIKVGASGNAEILIEGNTFESLVEKPAVNLASAATVTMNNNTYTNMTDKGLWAIENGGTVVGSDIAKVVSAKTDDEGETTYYDKLIEDAIAKAGNVSYNSLQMAVNAAESGATVTLIKDTNEDITIPSGKNITLDLAGKKLTNTNSHTITNEGTLTIKDSAGNGEIFNNTAGKSVLQNEPGATATIESGKLYKKLNNGNNDYYIITNHGELLTINGGEISSASTHSSAIENGWFTASKNTSGKNSKLIINGGKVSNSGVTANGGLYTLKNDDYGEMEIYGGTFTNTVSGAGTVLNWNKLNINGGTFNASGAAVRTLCMGVDGEDYSCEAGTTSISAGKFNGTIDTLEDYNKDIIVTISGGTFSSDPTDYVENGYYVSKNADDTWTVKQIVYVPSQPEPTTPPATTDTVTNPDGSTTSTTTQENTDGSTTTTVVDKDANGNVTGTTETVEKTEGNTTTKTETTTAADGSQTVTESTLVKNEDGSSKETGTITKADGTVATVETNTKADGSATEVIQETAKNDAGKEVAITTTTTTDTKGEVTGVTEKSDIKNVAENTTATVTVRKDGDDNVKTSRATVVKTVDEDTTKVTLAGVVVDQIVKASGTSNVTVTLDVKNEEDDTKYTVKVATKNLEAGNKLYVYKVNPQTGERTMVNDKLYTVSADGSITFNTKQNADFVLVNKASAAATNKAIKKTLTPAKTSSSIKEGKTTKMKLNSALNMENVKNITYSTTKSSVAKVSSNGTITAKKAGTAYITATITLKNGYKKTVRMKVAVKE